VKFGTLGILKIAACRPPGFFDGSSAPRIAIWAR
jgi:hypothetical protein